MTDTATSTPPHSTAKRWQIIITCADGLEQPLVRELASLDIAATVERTGRLHADLALADIYRVCLWSRVASRVLLPLAQTPLQAGDIAEQLYQFASTVDWSAWFGVEQTFAIRLSLDKRVTANQQFAMLRIKDAIADQFNARFGSRPNVDKQPDFAIVAQVGEKSAELALDLSGTSLHRRGYRAAMTDAPLKENLAAALLYSVDFHQAAYDALIDPMCGSGTLLIEALLMRADYAVGLDKAERQFGFYAWQAHDGALWQQLVNAASQRFGDGLARVREDLAAGRFCVVGLDADAQAIKATHKNLMAAGLGALLPQITLQQRALASLPRALDAAAGNDRRPTDWQQPLVITNPPYGERLGDEPLIKPLYQGFGKRLQQIFAADTHPVTVGVLAGKVEHADTLPLLDPQTMRCHNGALTVYFRSGQLNTQPAPSIIEGYQKHEVTLEGGQDFVNRLQKNLANLKKNALKQDVTNLRIYDADLPDFKVAVDVYGNFVHVQEYAAPKSIDAEVAKKRFNLALVGIREVLGVNREQTFIKTRARQSGNEQYDKKNNTGKFFVVNEPSSGGQTAYFLVNFSDYLDTGLFLDHRPMRQLIADSARGKRVLNLFAYTASASVHAALGGAKQVLSVDLSQNYLDWGRKNFALNGLAENAAYQFIAADVFDWLKNHSEQYDVIFIDPPTFSNSKKFKGTFDVQRDHAALINRAMNRLSADGVVYFSNNFSKFTLDDTLSARYAVEELTHRTIGFDFDVKRPIHRAWALRHKPAR